MSLKTDDAGIYEEKYSMENKEISKIYSWSVQNSGSYYYPKATEVVESCFQIREGMRYIEEYEFETIVDLKRKLAELWLGETYMDSVIKPVSVAAMKRKPSGEEMKDDGKELNEFIYIF